MAINDNLHRVWTEFFRERTHKLQSRFPGRYRAVVVETNDPLQLHRVRFKCPELHDFNLLPKDCPWAIPGFNLGGKNTGSWTSPMIDDIIWIDFEKDHPYGPVWIGFASGTRRQRYPKESIFTESPKPVDKKGEPLSPPQDYEKDYLPKDFRPMSSGWRDRYGSSEINCAVGFFPKEHEAQTAPQGVDGVTRSILQKEKLKPEINKPDRKYLARISKYGIYAIHADIGYYWKLDGDKGEFKGIGDFEEGEGIEEHQFEIDRYKYFVKLLNENKPNSKDRDQRRYEVRTRAGHKFEMRDVGYAQRGGAISGKEKVSNAKSRKEEGKYGGQMLSEWSESDERWLKLRSKGGHLFQIMDAGFHPAEDEFYKKELIKDIGPDCDQEKASDWIKRDARQMRLVTRWGIKFALDDRGSDPKKADTKEKDRANGWFLKTRRSWTTNESTQFGFCFEANDKDELDTTRWYSPKSKLVELNDKKDYLLMCTDLNGDLVREWKGLKENEFALSIGMTFNPELDTCHLKLDKANGYLRLKTSGNKDNGRKAEPEGFPSAEEIFNQGLEARDGRVGVDGAWTEVVDGQRRGMWFSKRYNLGIWRAKQNDDMFILMRDGEDDKSIIIRNATGVGPIQIFCAKDVQIIGENIALKANNTISLKAGKAINMEAGGAHAQLVPGAWNMDVPDNAPKHTGVLPDAMPLIGGKAQAPTGGRCVPLDPKPIIQKKIEPTDRAAVGNGPFDAIDEKIIKGG